MPICSGPDCREWRGCGLFERITHRSLMRFLKNAPVERKWTCDDCGGGPLSTACVLFAERLQGEDDNDPARSRVALIRKISNLAPYPEKPRRHLTVVPRTQEAQQ
jgi:hypothetical protein